MSSVWVAGVGTRFEHAFDLLEAAVRDCPDELWQSNMWPVADDGPDGTPWAVAWHALERLDFLLTGGFAPWEVWPPLAERLADGRAAAHAAAAGVTGHTGLDIRTMTEPWSRADLVAYADRCRRRASETLEHVTDERAAAVVGSKTYAARLLQAYDHVVEHAAQIRQFITAAGPIASAPPGGGQ